MRNLFVWYLPQAALFIGGYATAAQSQPPISGMAAAAVGLMLAAAYTGAVNLIMNLFARLRGRTSLQPHGCEPGGDGLRLAGTGRRLGKPTEERKRIRVRD